jgi:hypothetical protein
MSDKCEACGQDKPEPEMTERERQALEMENAGRRAVEPTAKVLTNWDGRKASKVFGLAACDRAAEIFGAKAKELGKSLELETAVAIEAQRQRDEALTKLADLDTSNRSLRCELEHVYQQRRDENRERDEALAAVARLRTELEGFVQNQKAWKEHHVDPTVEGLRAEIRQLRAGLLSQCDKTTENAARASLAEKAHEEAGKDFSRSIIKMHNEAVELRAEIERLKTQIEAGSVRGMGGDVTIAAVGGGFGGVIGKGQMGYSGGNGSNEPPTPARPKLWSWIRRLSDNTRMQVTGIIPMSEGFVASDGIAVVEFKAKDKGITWDLPAEPRRPVVGDRVWVRFTWMSGWQDRVIDRCGSLSFDAVKDGETTYICEAADYGETWFFEDERPGT